MTRTKMKTGRRSRAILLTLSALIAVGAGGLLQCSCQGDEDPSNLDEVEAAALTPTFTASAAAAPAVLEREEPEDPDARIGLSWSHEPLALQVYRSTAVHFRLDVAPEDHPTASCSWNFGDGAPVEKGCNVAHTFHGGQADQVITLTLRDGDWTWRSTRTVPLERLPVVDGLLDDASEGLSGLPAPPEPGATSFRFAVVADSAATGGVPTDVTTAVEALTGELRPELVLHAGGVVVPAAGDAAWGLAREALIEPLADAGVPLAWAMSPTDLAAGAQVPEPTAVQMVDGRHFPARYSFTHKGAFFLVLSANDREGVDEATLAWVREELSKARVYEARYVVSYLPIHKFGDDHLGTLDKKFRLYELFLRARVTVLFSAGYRVYFKGRYGALPVVSVGALAGPGGRLAGSDFDQPPSLVLVDQIDGVPERVLAVEGPTFDLAFDDDLLPETVEVYTR